MARYLGLLEDTQDEEGSVAYKLTTLGNSIAGKPAQGRNLALAERILSRRVFRQTMEAYLATGEMPPSSVVADFIIQAKLPLSGTTLGRRASTVTGWVRWIVDLSKGG